MQTIAPSFEDVTALVACFDNVQELQFGETVRENLEKGVYTLFKMYHT